MVASVARDSSAHAGNVSSSVATPDDYSCMRASSSGIVPSMRAQVVPVLRQAALGIRRRARGPGRQAPRNTSALRRRGSGPEAIACRDGDEVRFAPCVRTVTSICHLRFTVPDCAKAQLAVERFRLHTGWRRVVASTTQDASVGAMPDERLAADPTRGGSGQTATASNDQTTQARPRTAGRPARQMFAAAALVW